MCVSWSAHFHHPRRIYWKAPQEEGCTIKTVINLDVLLLGNSQVAYLLLQAAGVLTGQRAAFARMLTGSVCAAVSGILFAVIPFDKGLLLALMLQYTLPAPFIIPLFADLGDDAEYVSTTLSLGTVLAVVLFFFLAAFSLA